MRIKHKQLLISVSIIEKRIELHEIFSLQWIFLPDPATRNKLVFPPANKVDYRAACFCHRELIDIGYVCSVCLSSEYTYAL